MSRPLRIEYPGAWYHVMNRGAGRRAIFASDDDRRLFLSLLGELDETFAVETHAYCLLGNHYHLLLHTPRGHLGRAMRHLGGVYTQRVNRRAARDGPLFRGRYKAILVDAESYLLQLGRYIHLNPTSAGLCDRPQDYRWSSYPAYLGAVPAPAWLCREPTLRLLGRTGAAKRYRAFVEEGLDEETAAFYARGRLDPLFGDAAFRRAVAGRRLAGDRAIEIPDRRRVVAAPSLGRIIRVTAEEFGCAPRELQSVRRGRGRRNLPRGVAMALGRSAGGHPLAAIARAFGLGHYASVAKAIGRFKRLEREDRALARRVRRIRARLGGTKND